MGQNLHFGYLCIGLLHNELNIYFMPSVEMPGGGTESERRAREEAVRAYLDKANKEERKKEVEGGYVPHTIEEAKQRIEGLAEAAGMSVKEITEFPDDLTLPSKGEHLYVRPESFGGQTVLRLDHGDTTMLVNLRTDEYFAGDIYENGKFRGGNHDFSLNEVASQFER
jgi:hypothetical protein